METKRNIKPETSRGHMARRETGYKKDISHQEVELILEQLDPQYRLIFQIMGYMGLRINETLRIRLRDITRGCKFLRVHLLKTECSIKDRIIPIPLRSIIMDYIQDYDPKDYIFEPNPIGNSKNKHIQSATVRWKLLEVRKKLHLEDHYYIRVNGSPMNRISLHTFRRYFAKIFYEKSGNDLVLLKEVFGHKDLRTTEAYISSTTQEEAVANTLMPDLKTSPRSSYLRSARGEGTATPATAAIAVISKVKPTLLCPIKR